MSVAPEIAVERPVDAVRGTRDWLPAETSRLQNLETLLLDRFARAGYEPLRTPVLEPTELHERKSGAGIVSKLFELAGGSGGPSGVCLRPELTAGIVRAYTAAKIPPQPPWRVSHVGPVFRYETLKPGKLREFQQVGVERLGDGGPLADAEIIWLADWATSEVGITGATVRLGHVGLILEMLRRSGLPAPLGTALIEMLSEAAADGQGVATLEQGLEQLSGWLQTNDTPEIPGEVDRADDGGIDRLFRTLVPVVTGRRSGHEIIHRLRRKWDLGHGLLGALDRVRTQVHALADLKGNPSEVLARLGKEGESLAPDSVAAIRDLLKALEAFGIESSRVVLDLGFGRGIGFYSQMVFEIVAETPNGAVELCGGGRYDGLARVLGSDRDDRGVGFAFGLERLADVLDAQGRGPSAVAPRGFLVLAEDDAVANHAVMIATRLRVGGARTLLESGIGLDEAIARAEGAGLPRVLVIRGAATIILHDLISGDEADLSLVDLERLVQADLRDRPGMTSRFDQGSSHKV